MVWKQIEARQPATRQQSILAMMGLPGFKGVQSRNAALDKLVEDAKRFHTEADAAQCANPWWASMEQEASKEEEAAINATLAKEVVSETVRAALAAVAAQPTASTDKSTR